MRAIFIGGCDRSGTTYLAALLARLEGVVALPEAPFIPETARAVLERGETPNETVARFESDHRFRSFRETGRPSLSSPDYANLDATALIRRLVEDYAAATDAAPVDVFVEHSPDNIDRALSLPRFFDGAKFLHMVRDGRAVAASLIPLDWGPTNIIDMQRYWRRAVEKGLAAVRALGPDRALTVSYETLIAEPEMTLRHIAAFLGLAERAERLNGKTSYRPPGYSAKTHRLVQSAPDLARIERWRNELSRRQIELFEREAAPLLETLGLSCLSDPTRTPPPSSLELVLMKLRDAYEKKAQAARYRRRHRL
ncbi:MAG TPA: sulfotransferase [Parvularculaceae bacterium]|nr:sulfotransferase [Parvularculaceae bacterium]